MTHHAVHLPAVPGIDLEYRPASYFWPLDLETHLLSRIKGAERKAALKHLIKAGRIDEVPAFLTESALTADDRRAIGRLHPALMGGEYLPDVGKNEVIIARIVIASTTQDVTCVYARRRKHRIHYRVVDEYDGETLCGKATRTSVRPLTLGQLEEFFNGAWSLFDVLGMNFADGGYPLEQMLNFVVEVDSQFYPELGALYEQRIRAWAAGRQREPDPDEEATPAAPSGDMSDLKIALKLQDGIDEAIRMMDRERNGETTGRKRPKGKITDAGLVPKDDPMFSGSVEIFSRAGSRLPAAQATGPSNKPVNTISIRSWTAENYKKRSGWQVGTFHRASTSAAPSSSAAPNGDKADLKTVAALQDQIDEAISEQGKKDGYNS